MTVSRYCCCCCCSPVGHLLRECEAVDADAAAVAVAAKTSSGITATPSRYGEDDGEEEEGEERESTQIANSKSEGCKDGSEGGELDTTSNLASTAAYNSRCPDLTASHSLLCSLSNVSVSAAGWRGLTGGKVWV